MPSESGDDAVNHIVYGLSSLLCLELCEGEQLAEVFEWYAEVLGLHSCLHKFKVVDRSLGGLAEVGQQLVVMVYLGEGVLNAVSRLGEFEGIVDEFANLAASPIKYLCEISAFQETTCPFIYETFFEFICLATDLCHSIFDFA